MSNPKGSQLQLSEVIWKDYTALISAIFLGVILFVIFIASSTGVMITSRSAARYSNTSPQEYVSIGLVFAGICAAILAYRVIVLLRFCQNVIEVTGHITAVAIETIVSGNITYKYIYEYEFASAKYTKTFIHRRQFLEGTNILVFVNPARPHKPIVGE
jgi:preprotein translocase subunit SecY